ncbi:MAG: hypothetical protein RLZZ490_1839 [Cyanobacteriota bacterium]
MGNTAIGRNRSPHIGLHFPTEVEDDDGEGVVHPEQTKEDVVPTRNLAGAAATGAITGEAEAEVRFIGDKARATGVQYPFEENQGCYVDGEGVDVVNHEVSSTQGDGHHGDFSGYRNGVAAKGIACSS